MKQPSIYRQLLFSLWLVVILAVTASAEVVRKVYDFPYDSTLSRLAYQKTVESQSQQAFLRDYLTEKLGSRPVQETKIKIDAALFPTDQFLTSFKLVDLRLVSPTIAQAIVEAEVDLPAMVVALVRQNVLSFGDRPPRVMFVPDTFYDVEAVSQIRSIIYDSLKSTKLEVVDLSTSALVQLPKANGLLSEESLQRFAREYKVDYIVYVNSTAQASHHPYGGVICDTVLNYKLLRIGQDKVAGAGSIQDRGSGVNGQVAYLASLNQISKRLVTKSIGDLYLSVLANSEFFTRKDLETPIVKSQPGPNSGNNNPPRNNTAPQLPVPPFNIPGFPGKPSKSKPPKPNKNSDSGSGPQANGGSVTRSPQPAPPAPGSMVRAQAEIMAIYKTAT